MFTWFKKHIIFHILYIIVAPLCSAFLKRIDFYKAHHSEKQGALWLASYPVRLAEYLKRVMEMLRPHRIVICGGVFEWAVLGGAWQSLNFDKENIFGFETLIFATVQILSMHKQIVTLIWPL